MPGIRLAQQLDQSILLAAAATTSIWFFAVARDRVLMWGLVVFAVGWVLRSIQ